MQDVGSSESGLKERLLPNTHSIQYRLRIGEEDRERGELRRASSHVQNPAK
jgi:hypothetical protein